MTLNEAVMPSDHCLVSHASSSLSPRMLRALGRSSVTDSVSLAGLVAVASARGPQRRVNNATLAKQHLQQKREQAKLLFQSVRSVVPLLVLFLLLLFIYLRVEVTPSVSPFSP